MRRLLVLLSLLVASVAFAQGFQPVRANCPSCVLIAKQLTLSGSLTASTVTATTSVQTPAVTSTSTLSLGTSTATSVTVGRSGQSTTLNGSLTIGSKVTSYNGTSTAGNGVGALVAYGSQAGTSTSGANVFTPYTVGVSNALIEVGGWYRVTSWTSGTVSMQISYTDCNSGAISNINLFGHSLSGGAWVNTVSSTGPVQLGTTSFCAQAGSTITVKTNMSGVATGTFYAFLRQDG